MAEDQQLDAQASGEGDSWLERELAGCEFVDARLGSRYRVLARQLWEGFGQSIPLACQDWANTKAAYRFFSNERVDEASLLGGHFQSTRARFEASGGPVLVLHDTTEFSNAARQPEPGAQSTNGGVLMHSSLVVTSEGLPLGLAAIKFWTRDNKPAGKGAKRVNSTRIPIQGKESHRWLENLRQSTQCLGEPARCVHVGDRESDIFELFDEAQTLGTHFLVRSNQDRRAGDSGHTIAHEMAQVALKGLHHVEVRNEHGHIVKVALEVRYQRLWVLPPKGKQARHERICLTVIHAREPGSAVGRKPIDWRLITDLAVDSPEQAIEKLQWYALRWRIETFHKILKSGAKAEESKLIAAARLTNLICVLCILGWRVFWLTMINRECPHAPASMALTPMQVKVLDHLVPDRKPTTAPKDLAHYLIKIARLGGYLGRASDPPPGNLVVWRGLSRLTDIVIGMEIGLALVGN